MARAREMAQMAAAGGADAPFGVSCTPAVRPRGAPQKIVGGSFRVYHMRKRGCAGDAGAMAGRLLRGAILGRFAAKTAAASALGEV